MSKEERKVPELRFKDFHDDWEQREIGEISCILTGGTPRTNEQSFWNPKEIPWMSSGEINKKRLLETDDMISEKGLENSSARWVQKNSVLIALAGQGKTRGKVAINTLPLTTNQSIAAIQPSDILDSEYLYQNLDGRYHELRIKSSGDGTRGGLNKKIISELSIDIPKLYEQVQIGKFLKSLDIIITLHQRKINTLEAQKKAYLNVLFPKINEFTPSLRFNNFKDEWKQCKLDNLAEIVRGASPRPIKDKKWFDSNSDIGWLRISDVTEQNGKIHYLEQKLSLEGQHKTRVLHSPHLLLSIAASVGKPVINYVKTGVHDGFLIFLNPKFEIYFVFEWLESIRYKWKRYGQPGSQINLNSEIVKNQTIKIPSILEQNTVSEFLNGINNLINLHQEKLHRLNIIKQVYLNKMFI